MANTLSFAGLTDLPVETQLARLEAVAAATRIETIDAASIKELLRELPRVRDGRVWHLGWTILQRVAPSEDAARFAQWILGEPSNKGDLRRDAAFHYVYEKFPDSRAECLRRGLESQDPGVRMGAASKLAEIDPERAGYHVLDAYELAMTRGAHDVFEAVEAWLEKLASASLLAELERRQKLPQEDDTREQYAEWANDMRDRLGARS